MKAKKLLESIYDYPLKEGTPYQSQLHLLNSSGELSNMVSLMSILFGLCDIVDQQQAQIDALTNRSQPDTNEPVQS